MRKLKEDMRDFERWFLCTRRNITFKVTYRSSGAVYCNPLDMSTTVSDKNTPILFTDDSGVYWTDSLHNFKKQYVQRDGSEIDQGCLELMKNGEFVYVRPKCGEPLWAFKVYVDDYRWDCPYGANASGVQHGDGDYLVCRGKDRPDLRTVQLVRNEAFKRFYIGVNSNAKV